MRTRFGTTICAIASRLQDAAEYERRALAIKLPRKGTKGRPAAIAELERLSGLAAKCFAAALEAERMFGPSNVGVVRSVEVLDE